eukprot:1161380-Pelagomonas_calceolata.AAC.17
MENKGARQHAWRHRRNPCLHIGVPFARACDGCAAVERANWFQFLMLDENNSPAADQPESRAVGQPPCYPCNICLRGFRQMMLCTGWDKSRQSIRQRRQPPSAHTFWKHDIRKSCMRGVMFSGKGGWSSCNAGKTECGIESTVVFIILGLFP